MQFVVLSKKIENKKYIRCAEGKLLKKQGSDLTVRVFLLYTKKVNNCAYHVQMAKNAAFWR